MKIRRGLHYMLMLAIAACSSSKPTAISATDYRLHDIWVLKELNGKNLTVSDYPREAPRMELNTKEGKVLGNSGCNNFFGSFSSQGEKITFSDLGSTKMFCEKSVETEFFEALAKAQRFQVKDLHLLLYKDEVLIASFLKVD